MSNSNVDTGRKDRAVASDNAGPPPISIVVIGRNEGERLIRCLKSVRRADYPADRYELIYVDSDSTDGSCGEAEKLEATVLRIRPERPSAAAARNAGLGAASHELVQFLDGDTVLDPSWLKRAVEAISQPGVGCVFGRVEEIEPRATIYNFWAHHDWHAPPGRADACGGIALFRRDALVKSNGFDCSLIAGEEGDLCVRLLRDQSLYPLCLNEPMVLHDINMTRFGQYWRRCFRTGFGYAQLAARYPTPPRWRRHCQRNLLHASAIPLAAVLCLLFRSPWPAVVWAALLLAAILRNAWRLRRRVGTLGAALLYSIHHYLSKIPMAWGQCVYWLRAIFRRSPQPLVEYR